MDLIPQFADEEDEDQHDCSRPHTAQLDDGPLTTHPDDLNPETDNAR